MSSNEDSPDKFGGGLPTDDSTSSPDATASRRDFVKAAQGLALGAVAAGLATDANAQYNMFQMRMPPVTITPPGLWAFGGGSWGCLGINSTANRSTLTQAGTNTTWVKVSAGYNTSFAWTSDGACWVWGRNYGGGLGLNLSFGDQSNPVQLGAVSTWAAIEGGLLYAIGVRTNGTLWSWGDDNCGNLGSGTSTYKRSSPVQVGSANNWNDVQAGLRQSINNTAYASYGKRTDGTIWGWGHNGYGQLGLGTTNNVSAPTQIGTLSTWTQISAGGGHVLARRSDGTLWVWGRNANGQLGDNTVVFKSSPVQLGNLSTWSKVAAGGEFSMAIRQDGTMWAWGQNNQGQLGIGTAVNSNVPVQVGTLSTWANIACGGDSTIALKTDSTAWAWGSNGSGRLGLGDVVTRSSPTQIGTNTKWLAAAAGTSHGLLINS